MKKVNISILLVFLAVMIFTGCTYFPPDTPEQIDNDTTAHGTTERASLREICEESDIIDCDLLASNFRGSPAGLNETIVTVQQDYVEMPSWGVGRTFFELEMVEVISGDEAWQIIKNADPDNKPPRESKEYIMAKFRIKVLETQYDDQFSSGQLYITEVSGTGKDLTYMTSVSGVEPTFFNQTLYEGKEHIGWKFFKVYKDDEGPTAVFDLHMPGEVWFDLRADRKQ